METGKLEIVEAPYANRLKKLLKLALGAIIVLGLLVLILLVISVSQEASSNAKGGVCLNSACISASNLLMENMNLSVDPCEDFFQFTCGGYIKKTRLHEDQSGTNTFSQLSDKLEGAVSDLLMEPVSYADIAPVASAKYLYRSCVNEDNIEQNGEFKFLRFLTEEFGGWPLLNEYHYNPSVNNTMKNLVSLHQVGTNPLFYFYASINPADPNYYVLRISQASWFLLKDYYEDPRTVAAYKEFIIKIARYLNSTSRDLVNEVNRMFELEKRLVMSTYSQERKRRSTFRNMTFRDLEFDLPQFNWREYADALFDKNSVPERISNNERILVDHFDYIQNATQTFSYALNYQKRDLDNLLIWALVKNSLDFLPRKYSEAFVDLQKTYFGSSRARERASKCADFVMESMEFAVGRMYVPNNFDSNSKNTAIDMIENIRSEFVKILYETSWMDDKSRKHALEKAHSIDVKIGYPEFTFNDTHLNEIYQDYKFSNKEFLQNVVTMNRAEVKKMFRIFRQKRDRKQWFSGPAVVNAYYSPTSNQICFPVGILQRPFYDQNYPKYLNYGAIGSVIGHEITHGFDDKGRMFDKDGIYHKDGDSSLWTNATIENYKRHAQCIIDQYSKYHVKSINMTLNGYQTLGENIADNGGIKESFRAYKRWLEKNGPEPRLPGLDFSPEQLFFINYGQVWCGKYRDQYLKRAIIGGVHSLGQFRVIGTTSNSEAFSKAFNCKAGQKNNPTKKCAVW